MDIFNSKQEKAAQVAGTNSNNIIGQGTVIEGDLVTAGNIRVEGKVVGNIKCKSKVVIGQSAVVEGNIMSSNVEIFGELRGFVKTSGTLCLKATAVVHGELVAKDLSIEAGAKFEGQCKMTDNVKEIELSQPRALGESQNDPEQDDDKVRNLKEQLKAVNAY